MQKEEADSLEDIDYVISFEELAAIFIAKNIEPSAMSDSEIKGKYYGWNFAVSGGVENAVIANLPGQKLNILKVNGICELKSVFKEKNIEEYDFIEGMSCENGCIGGPCILINPNIPKSILRKINKN